MEFVLIFIYIQLLQSFPLSLNPVLLKIALWTQYNTEYVVNNYNDNLTKSLTEEKQLLFYLSPLKEDCHFICSLKFLFKEWMFQAIFVFIT